MCVCVWGGQLPANGGLRGRGCRLGVQGTAAQKIYNNFSSRLTVGDLLSRPSAQLAFGQKQFVFDEAWFSIKRNSMVALIALAVLQLSTTPFQPVSLHVRASTSQMHSRSRDYIYWPYMCPIPQNIGGLVPLRAADNQRPRRGSG